MLPTDGSFLKSNATDAFHEDVCLCTRDVVDVYMRGKDGSHGKDCCI